MRLRRIFSKHQSTFLGKLWKLEPVVEQLEELVMGTTLNDFPLPKIRAPVRKIILASNPAKLEELMELKKQLVKLGIPRSLWTRRLQPFSR